MWWKIKNQLIIIIKISIFFGFLLGIYTYTVITIPPSCFDQQQNGDEHGKDCGGSCALYCTEEVGNPRILEQGFVTQGKNKYQFYVKLDVPFARMISGKSDWSLDLLDKDKKIILKEPVIVKGYITSDRQTYIISDIIETERIPVYSFWKQVLTQPYFTPVINFTNANIIIKNSKLSSNDLYTIIDGVITHSIKDEVYNYIDIIVLLYNDKDEIYALSKQRLSRIEYGKDYPIHITFPRTSKTVPPARFLIIPQIIPMGFFK